jgi:hypothetical protein
MPIAVDTGKLLFVPQLIDLFCPPLSTSVYQNQSSSNGKLSTMNETTNFGPTSVTYILLPLQQSGVTSLKKNYTVWSGSTFTTFSQVTAIDSSGNLVSV